MQAAIQRHQNIPCIQARRLQAWVKHVPTYIRTALAFWNSTKHNIQLHKAFQAMSLRVESRRYFPPARKTQVIWQSHRNTITPREPTKGPPAEITTDWRDERCQPERKQKLPPSFATTQIQHAHDTSYSLKNNGNTQTRGAVSLSPVQTLKVHGMYARSYDSTL